MSLNIGDKVEVEIGNVAHGGHFVGRYEGQVIFVRHTAPGEKVICEITSIGSGGKLAFADAKEILQASPHRIDAPCKFASECGGCDFQHLDLAFQRQLKTQVLKEQLVRIGKLDSADSKLESIEVAAMSENETGLNWRSRMRYATDPRGRFGFRKHGSNEVVAIDKCLIAQTGIDSGPEVNRPWAPNSEFVAAKLADGRITVHAVEANPEVLTENIGKFTYSVASNGFWQAHKDAPTRYTDEVLNLLDLKPGEHVVEFYAGVGLFTLPIAQIVGAAGRVDAIEGDRQAARLLNRNSRNRNNITAFAQDVREWFKYGQIRKCDKVLLDPPRSGAGAAMLQKLVKLRPNTIVYVACDPASLGRDVKILADLGYEISEIRAIDGFPMTHHFETFVKFSPR